MSNVTKLSGACLCQAVKYSVEATPKAFYLCHCHQCQKLTGSGFAANILMPIDTIQWQGSENLTHYQDPERDFSKTFCKLCGSGLPHINKSKTSLVIPAGSLDSAPELLPMANLFHAESAPWLEKGIAAVRYKGFS